MVSILRVRCGEDLRQIESHQLVVFETGRVEIPEGLSFTNLNNVHFFGNTAVGGKTMFYGYPLILKGARNVSFLSIAFRLTRPDGMLPEQYEKWWNSPKILCDNGHNGRKFWQVKFVHCSMSGNTDEIDVGPENHVKWAQEKPGQYCGHSVEFINCMMGPSSMGKMADRQHHNFGSATSYVDSVSVVNCVYAGHNRRMNQWRGRGSQQSCLIYGYGTQAIGVHAGSEVDVRRCVFIPSDQTALTHPQSDQRVGPVKEVQDTVGPNASLYLEDNCEMFVDRRHIGPRRGNSLVEARQTGFIQEQQPEFFQDFPGHGLHPMSLDSGLAALQVAGCINRDSLDEETVDLIQSGNLFWRDADQLRFPLDEYSEMSSSDLMIPSDITGTEPLKAYLSSVLR
jgi:hypothetical protein